jgi:hypothetical protein
MDLLETLASNSGGLLKALKDIARVCFLMGWASPKAESLRQIVMWLQACYWRGRSSLNVAQASNVGFNIQQDINPTSDDIRNYTQNFDGAIISSLL